MQRQPAVAGRFYPYSEEDLLKEVHGYLRFPGRKAPAVGIVGDPTTQRFRWSWLRP